MRWVITRVLPEPGPARIKTGPSIASTASRWAAFRPVRSGGGVACTTPPRGARSSCATPHRSGPASSGTIIGPNSRTRNGALQRRGPAGRYGRGRVLHVVVHEPAAPEVHAVRGHRPG